MVAIKRRIMNYAASKHHDYIRTGRLKREYECAMCGKEGEFIDGEFTLEAHHPDYTKPLFTVYLCRGCHNQHHKDINLANKIAKYKAIIEYVHGMNEPGKYETMPNQNILSKV